MKHAGSILPFGTPRRPNIILFGDNHLARCTALVEPLPGTNIITQDKECIACCARRALEADKPHQQLIISRLSVEDAQHLLGDRHSLLDETREHIPALLP